jgi:predicted unusual protein kinase regulating ubiquinone biosynthesis (AarF/ABC1/UbiB family)
MHRLEASANDPYFANYRSNSTTHRLVLFDFGAVRDVAPATAQNDRILLRAGIARDRASATRAALDLGSGDWRDASDRLPSKRASMSERSWKNTSDRR